MKKEKGIIKEKKYASLRVKSTLLVTAIIIIVASILSAFFITRQKEQAYSDLKRRGMSLVKNLAYNSEYGVLISNKDVLDNLIKGLKSDKDILYVLIQDTDGKLIASTEEGVEPEIVQASENKKAVTARDSFIQKVSLKGDGQVFDIAHPIVTEEKSESDFFEIAEPDKSSEKRKIGVARIGMTLQNVNAEIKKNSLITILLTIAIIILSVIATNILIKKLLMHIIYQLLNAAKAIGRGELNSEINIQSSDELGELANAFKDMQVKLSTLADQAKSVANGNLTEEVEFEGDLADSFNLMSENLRVLVKQINDAGLKLDTYADEILSSSEEQASSATEQASSTSEISTTMEELSQAAKEISKNADMVAKMAEKSLNNAQIGKSAVYEAVKGTEAIKTSTQESARRISELGKKSQRVSEIIEIINEIAEQTKLLSLNASIEAARAGEAGKGFSVVAEEIRRLSENVSESVREVKDIIKEIQSSINTSVLSSEKMGNTVDQGLELSQKVGESLEKILDTVEKTVDFGNQIRHSTQQQETASEQVSETVREMASVSRQTADISRETAETAKKLKELSTSLKQAISRLKVE